MVTSLFLSTVPYQQNPYSPRGSSNVIQCYRCGDTCKGEVVRVHNNHFHIRCFTCQGRRHSLPTPFSDSWPYSHPRTCHRAGRTNKHRQLRYLQRPKKILLKLVIRILSSAAWHETEGRVRDVVGYKVEEGAWRPWSGSADPEGKRQSCKLTLHIWEDSWFVPIDQFESQWKGKTVMAKIWHGSEIGWESSEV